MKRTSTRADSARNREALLDAAILILREDVDAPLQAFADAAGLSRRAIYGHFPGRDELVDAALARGAERIAEAVDHPRDDDPLVGLARIGASLWDHVADVTAVARTALSPAHAATVAAALTPVRLRVRDCLTAAAASGEVRTDIPLDTLALLVERAALDVLDLADPSEPARARRLAMTHPLCAAGVGATHPAPVATEVEGS